MRLIQDHSSNMSPTKTIVLQTPRPENPRTPFPDVENTNEVNEEDFDPVSIFRRYLLPTNLTKHYAYSDNPYSTRHTGDFP